MIDKSTLEAQVFLNNGNEWNATVTHKLSSSDTLKAVVKSNKMNEPRLTYTRKQDDIELTLSAPVSSNICADAGFKITRSFDL